MQWLNYKEFFQKATGYEPFPYQVKVAEIADFPVFMKIPTGAGKTATVILAWIWRRFYHPDLAVRKATPRRLVYCLPMRTLVEQTRDNTEEFIKNIASTEQLFPTIPVQILMGGETGQDWMLEVEKEQIIIGTQDMLLSAALNRGYGLSRFRWPVAFALLQNDCFWVFDEVQLMGAGLATGTQLEAFRRKLSVYGKSQSVWMSATLEKDWFNTVDFEKYAQNSLMCELSVRDETTPVLHQRLNANKILHKVSPDLPNEKPSKNYSKPSKYAKKLAEKILGKHQKKTLTLVIVNKVKRAQELYQALLKNAKNTGAELLLLHSRFRPQDKQILKNKLTNTMPQTGRIVVATQVVEAGLDISAAVLFTELAPWASLVQRFGRCNRRGEYPQAEIYWLDVDKNNAPPYDFGELESARKTLQSIKKGQSVAPAKLPPVKMPFNATHVLRSKDIRELFDTSPDLSGNDIDIARFIREQDDSDVQVYWREWAEKEPPADLPASAREEICTVQIADFKEFLKNNIKTNVPVWNWDYLEGQWLKVSDNNIYPGSTILLHAKQGGYEADFGWTGQKKNEIQYLEMPKKQKGEDITVDHAAADVDWQTLAEHSDDVVNELKKIINSLGLPAEIEQTLILACRWHDAGKAHQVFQETMHNSGEVPDKAEIWAKSPGNCRHSVKYFRHELASALAFLQNAGSYKSLETENCDLIAYLIAAHHGKVRLSVRSLPDEKLPAGLKPETRISRGVWEGSETKPANIGGGFRVPVTKLNLQLLELGITENGSKSWLEGTLGLRDQFGPFKLAFLETLVRLADMRASALFEKNKKGG